MKGLQRNTAVTGLHPPQVHPPRAEQAGRHLPVTPNSPQKQSSCPVSRLPAALHCSARHSRAPKSKRRCKKSLGLWFPPGSCQAVRGSGVEPGKAAHSWLSVPARHAWSSGLR